MSMPKLENRSQKSDRLPEMLEWKSAFKLYQIFDSSLKTSDEISRNSNI